MDIDECKLGSHNCVKNAICVNLDGRFSCKCRYGFWGDATKKCEGKRAFSLASFDKVIFFHENPDGVVVVFFFSFFFLFFLYKMNHFSHVSGIKGISVGENNSRYK